VSIFAHPAQNPPWGLLKVSKIAAGCRLKDSVKNGGVQGRRGVGGRKPPPSKWSKHARFLAKDEGRRIPPPVGESRFPVLDEARRGDVGFSRRVLLSGGVDAAGSA
jgi:hypothetical protein